MIKRGIYGVEYFPTRQNDRQSGGLGCIVAAVAALVLVSLAWTLFSRLTGGEDEPPPSPPPPAPSIPAAPPVLPPAAPTPSAPAEPVKPAPPDETLRTDFGKRPPQVRNLLMRLEEAERKGDVEMGITTIEAIRALPGSPAADLDDSLARRLGALNLRRLFELKSAQWVKQVEVKRGDSASRIAAENGSTLASMARLNGGRDLSKLRIGEKVSVMDHPRFRLVVHRRTRLADLSLNGKFFRRYDLSSGVSGAPGAYEVTLPVRSFWSALGVSFGPVDRAEIETLLPKGAPVLVSEL